MKNTLLIQVLQQFSPVQIKSWTDYCQSSYHLTNVNLQKLSQVLQSHINQRGATLLDKQATWQQLHPDSVYRASTMNNYLSDLLQATYAFLAHDELQRKEDTSFPLQIQALLDLGLPLVAQRILKKWKSKWEGHPEQGATALNIRYQIASFEDTIELLASKRKHTTTLQRKSQLLDQYYTLEQLVNYCNMLSRQHIVQGQYDLPYLKEIFNKVEASDQSLPYQSAINIYMALARLLQSENDDASFPFLEEQLEKYPDALPPAEKRTVYNFLLNYCVQRINLGETHYYQKVLAIYRSLLEEQLLLQDQRISQWTYTNIITSGSRLKAWEWTENFLETYRAYLPAQDQYNAYHYNLAALRYEQANYDIALQGLHQVEFTDAFYHLGAKSIQLKIYYQKEETSSFQALLFATRQFVSRNRQLSSLKKNAYLNFLKLIKQLFDLRYEAKYWNLEKQQHRIQKLQDRLSNKAYTANYKDWLSQEQEKLLEKTSSNP
ncbi:MAG: hypothetical protein ACRBG0_25240 [Lewinella sp.]|jgi:hypothetical protein|uniref:hypothetical protein n=1 Tax=Lewinella sp. TaxID=2004506 RepID=UPI003D6A5989